MSAASELGPIFEIIIGKDAPLQLNFWDGSTIGPEDAKAQVTLNRPEALRRIIWSPGELGLSRAYVTGDVDITGDIYFALNILLRVNPDYISVGTKTVVRTLLGARRLGVFGRPLPAPPEEAKPQGLRHSKKRDKEAISHHYDVGNDFYRLVLGPSMTYSCARFIEEDDSLESAQFQKYDLIARKLGLKPGMRHLDVGCGWGGMVMHAAKNYGTHSVGVTISEEQAKLARERVAEAGLSDLVEIRVQDYRDLKGEEFDAISSIGMFEHVGKAMMLEYFKTLNSVLVPGGRLLNHAIDTPEGTVMPENGFIHRYVFPDGELQDIGMTIDAMQQAEFEVWDVETLRDHYAKTLRHWVANLEKNWDAAVALVGSNRARVWRIYMAGSAVSFETYEISIHQTLAIKTPVKGPDAGEAKMPLTRSSYV